MNYLEKVLGIKVTYENEKFEQFPNFIATRYQLKGVSLDGIKAVFVYPCFELERIDILKKHIERIQRTVNLPVVLILKELTYHQKEYLIRERIPFVVDSKQIYLPFMALYLQERCNAEKPLREKLLPSSQMLFLYFIYNGAKELQTSQAVKELGFTPTSISRASKQLEEKGLLQTKKIGVQKILFSKDTPQELFEKAINELDNPVKRIIYIPKELVSKDLVESRYSALTKYSMLNATNIKYYATNQVSEWKEVLSNILYDSEKQVALEMWKYDPRKLSNNGLVDILSLSLALREDDDERVEEAIEEMLNNLWRKMDGNRN